MYAYFPIVWSFGTEPDDGIGGGPVSDAGTLYIVKSEEDMERDNSDRETILVASTTLNELVDAVIDGVVSDCEVVGNDHIESLNRLKKALLDAATRIDKSLEKGRAI